MPDTQPFILTLQLDPASFETLNHLRQKHFPPRRNFLSAHITLFHALPADEEALVRETLTEICQHTPPLALQFKTLRFLGQGVAIEVDCPALLTLRRELATRWQSFLTRQDQQGYRPHVTVQNKVTSSEARHLFDQLCATWQPFEGNSEACLLWRYRGGPWEAVGEFPFQTA